MSDFPPNLSIRPLTIEDLDQCIELETKGFPENERASPEKLKYRLTVCPELCSGLFIREYIYKYNAINLPDVAESLEKKHESDMDDVTKDGAEKTDVDREQHEQEDEDDEDFPSKSSVTKETLVGHIIGTKISGDRITNESMELPTSGVPGSGHIESSRHIGIHSVVIDPVWQGKNLGALLLHDYIQKLSNQDLGDQIFIIVHESLIPFYEKIGFNNLGESKCKFADTVWYDMAIDLVAVDDL